jgi:hypothetical protein
MPQLHLSHFSCDATPPAGHPLCGGWIEPVRGVDDPLRVLGVVLLGSGSPVVLAVVDWCGIRNDANLAWRKALAEAAHTVPENVAVHCVHPHNAPFADTRAQQMLAAIPGAPPSLDLKFFDQCVGRAAESLRESLKTTRTFNHIGTGQAKIEQVASNRRVLGPDGKVRFTRTSATKDPKARAEPEGLVDPILRTLSFWDGNTPLAALSYYATHPMSYYGDGRVSADFCGLARQKRQDEEKGVFQTYFTGCAGNVTAGKYNDGSKENRAILRDRMLAGMTAAWRSTQRMPVTSWTWQIESVKLPPRTEANFGAEESRKALHDDKAAKAKRGNAAFQLAWLERLNRPIPVTCLHIGNAAVLHLPGEPFIEYQLYAQKRRDEAFVCVAGYGDGGPGYLPTKDAYWQAGYEPTVALSAPGSEAILQNAIDKVLARPANARPRESK